MGIGAIAGILLSLAIGLAIDAGESWAIACAGLMSIGAFVGHSTWRDI